RGRRLYDHLRVACWCGRLLMQTLGFGLIGAGLVCVVRAFGYKRTIAEVIRSPWTEAQMVEARALRARKVVFNRAAVVDRLSIEEDLRYGYRLLLTALGLGGACLLIGLVLFFGGPGIPAGALVAAVVGLLSYRLTRETLR